MSYRLDFTPDARTQWGELEVGVQEFVLDELDRLAAVKPWQMKRAGDAVHDLAFDVGTVCHYVFLHLHVNSPARVITILGVGHHARAR